ncbi:hypothetical protein [Salinimicrobium tongyeongense]|uniref:hypothetical protein n=1 Tax=Salinimicrobium tongyeongense TaxID=2809707 RepID=UPI00223591DB|nr:hypothetical protein [Salinimicrobium tongyeongense]
MKYLKFLKYLFLLLSIIVFTLYIPNNSYINKYLLAVGYLMIFLVPVLDRYEKRQLSRSRKK